MTRALDCGRDPFERVLLSMSPLRHSASIVGICLTDPVLAHSSLAGYVMNCRAIAAITSWQNPRSHRSTRDNDRPPEKSWEGSLMGEWPGASAQSDHVTLLEIDLDGSRETDSPSDPPPTAGSVGFLTTL